MNYYNEFDPYAAQWLRNLIAAGEIPNGDVDERSISDVKPGELTGYTQCHFFAGIGGWSLALRLAGWPDNRPVWTGSAPCQPYSVASVANGGPQGQADERHLVPVFNALIGKQKPPVVFGEQVSSAVEWGWLDEVFGSLEAQGYACGAAILPASAAGADHERKRLYWTANAGRKGRKRYKPINGILSSQKQPYAVTGDVFTKLRDCMAGNHADLLHDDGVSVAVERCAAKGYGNAIVPQVAAIFIRAVMACE